VTYKIYVLNVNEINTQYPTEMVTNEDYLSLKSVVGEKAEKLGQNISIFEATIKAQAAEIERLKEELKYQYDIAGTYSNTCGAFERQNAWLQNQCTEFIAEIKALTTNDCEQRDALSANHPLHTDEGK